MRCVSPTRNHHDGIGQCGRSGLLAALLAAIFASFSNGLGVLMRQRDLNQLVLVYGVFVGCLATPVMVSPVACALAFWVPVCVGILVAGRARPAKEEA